MCGIAGIINFNGFVVPEEKVLAMMQKMRHRGPNDEGAFIESHVGLGFVRLSILDLSPLGHQPMIDESGRYVIIFNGEIYNYIEIRHELKAKGYNFHSDTDTEVLLNSYIEWGQSCLDRFNGMFAFAIYDRHKKTLFIARDHFGIKPFYYYIDDERFIFASEIPPILEVLGKKLTPDLQVVFDYLTFNRTDQTEFTFFNGIKKLKHGYSLTLNTVGKEKDKLRDLKKWYNLYEKVENTIGFKSPQEYREMFNSAVKLQLRSDVPVGVSLSGGLDSSSIVSVILKNFNQKDLHTFSAVYGIGMTGDESVFIDEFRPDLKNMFFTTPTSETLFNDKERFITAHAEPIPSARPYAQYKVMELAKENVVVTLDGQGADEQLAGYHYFYGFYFKELLHKWKFVRLFHETNSYLRNHKSLYGFKAFVYLLLPEMMQVGTRAAKNGYINKDFIKEYGSKNQVTKNLYSSRSLNKSFLDHFEYKLEHLLKWEDINSMAFSLESRVPFLDHRLVEKTLALKPEQVIKNGVNKYILREALKGTLPEKIRKRKDKIGFDNPADDWFRYKNFQIFINDIFNNGHFFKEGIVDVNKAKKLYALHLKRKINIHIEIWKWINLNLWYDIFFK